MQNHQAQMHFNDKQLQCTPAAGPTPAELLATDRKDKSVQQGGGQRASCKNTEACRGAWRI